MEKDGQKGILKDCLHNVDGMLVELGENFLKGKGKWILWDRGNENRNLRKVVLTELLCLNIPIAYD